MKRTKEEVLKTRCRPSRCRSKSWQQPRQPQEAEDEAEVADGAEECHHQVLPTLRLPSPDRTQTLSNATDVTNMAISRGIAPTH